MGGKGEKMLFGGWGRGCAVFLMDARYKAAMGLGVQSGHGWGVRRVIGCSSGVQRCHSSRGVQRGHGLGGEVEW